MTDRKGERRYLQFSLRTLLVFVLLVSIGMSWLGVKMARARRQKEAVEVVLEVGGEVRYDYELYPKERPVPAWLRELFGDDFFFDVVWVICGPDLGDDEAIYLKRLTNLEMLLVGAQITDAGLENIGGLIDLRHLFLYDMEATDAGLEHLKGLTNLETLVLRNTPITDAALEHLKGLTNLEYLDLSHTGMTGPGLASIPTDWDSPKDFFKKMPVFREFRKTALGRCFTDKIYCHAVTRNDD